MSALPACPHCETTAQSALVCEACGELLEPHNPPSPFAVFGLEPRFALDLPALQKRRLALTRALHPDFHGTADAETRRLAEDSTAALNQAHALLADDFRRADWLVTQQGGPREGDERGMPAEFLAEVLEWNETIEEVRAGRSGALDGLREALTRRREEARAELSRTLDVLPTAAPALRRARQTLNAVRYLERALRELGELALAARKS